MKETIKHAWATQANMHIHANMQNLISPQLVARVVVSFDFNCTPVAIRTLQMGAVFIFDGGLCADYVLNLLLRK